jgi:hypothetical protein
MGVSLFKSSYATNPTPLHPKQVRGLMPRSGWQQGLSHALTGSGMATGALEPGAHVQELPVPVVQVFCGRGGFEVSASAPTLNPMFPKNG